MKTAFALLASVLISTSVANAGREAGGSKAVVCPHEQPGKQARLLDFYRLETEWGLTYAPVEGANEWEALLKFSERIRKYDEIRANTFLLTARRDGSSFDFHKDMRFVDNANFTIINDSNEIAVPVGCHIELLINQKVNLNPDDKKYRVNARVWAMLSPSDRAGAIIHELLYKGALERGATTSDNSAYLTAVLGSAEFDKLGWNQYFKRLAFAGESFRVRLIEAVHSAPRSDFTTLNGVAGYDHMTKFWAATAEKMNLSFESMVAKGFKGNFSLSSGSQISFDIGTRFIESFTAAKGSTGSLTIQGRQVPLNMTKEVVLQDGLVSAFYFDSKSTVVLKNDKGRNVKLRKDVYVMLDENGRVTDFCLVHDDSDTCESYKEPGDE